MSMCMCMCICVHRVYNAQQHHFFFMFYAECSFDISSSIFPVCFCRSFLFCYAQMTKEVSSNNSSNARITIVGCYYCNGNASSDTIPPFFEKIVNTIKKQNGTCVQAVLKNSLLLAGANRDKNRLCITASRDSQEVQCTMNGLDTRASTTKQRTEVASCAQANALVTQLLQEVQGQQQQQKQQQQSLQYILIDTEDYLAGDCDTDRAEQRDFRNYECNRMVERLVLLLQQQQ